MVTVQGFDPRPNIRIKASDDADLPSRRYGFVEAIQELDPIGSLGLLAPDFKVLFFPFSSLLTISHDVLFKKLFEQVSLIIVLAWGGVIN